MRRAWFAYTAGSKGPIPNIFYDDIPNTKNSLNPQILQVHSLNSSYLMNERGNLTDEVWPSFNSLMKDFPYTGDVYNKGETFTLDHKEAAE